MDDINLDSPGKLADGAALRTPKGQELYRLLSEEEIAFARLVECRRDGDDDVVVFEVEVELGQLKSHPIQPIERIAVKFTLADESFPETLALRRDFPLVPHLNIQFNEFPRSLCLYDQPYDELKHQWTGPKFVERIRTWLALTAKGKLHDNDQPLEPLLWGNVGQIVLPHDLLSRGEARQPLRVTASSLATWDMFLVAEDDDGDVKGGVPYFPIFLTCPVQTHGVIRFRPRNLQKLAELTDTEDFDLLAQLRDRISTIKDGLADDTKRMNQILESAIIIILAMPKSRTDGGKTESVDLWAFLTGKNVRTVGVDIGIWMEIEGNLGKEPFPPDDKTGENIELDLLNPRFSLSSSTAASLNAWETPDPIPRIVAIGAGALGSQILVNLKRSGLTVETIIDEDRLLPHNLARHALPGSAMGFPKAESMSYFLNDILSSGEQSEGIAANVLKPGEKRDAVEKATGDADVILDMSASVAVARSLASDVQTDARRVSIFLNPTGTDLVVLAEDAERTCSLDMLEMQFYRALIDQHDLAGHFEPTERRQRYGQSCRDITSRIPQDLMAVQGGVGARALRRILADPAAQIAVWRANDDLEVSRIALTPTPVVQREVSDWTIKLDAAVVGQLQALRASKIPNETGGVLIGSFDVHRRIAYIVDTIPSPPDSDEWPTLYIRGSKGLRRIVENVVEQTDGALHYVGEWHSHPDGCSTMPSPDDMQVFAWLTDRMRQDGFPGLMMIVGDKEQLNCFIGEMMPIENLIPLIVV